MISQEDQHNTKKVRRGPIKNTSKTHNNNAENRGQRNKNNFTNNSENVHSEKQKHYQKNQKQPSRQSNSNESNTRQGHHQRDQKPQPFKSINGLMLGGLQRWNIFKNENALEKLYNELVQDTNYISFNDYYDLPQKELSQTVKSLGYGYESVSNRRQLLVHMIEYAHENKYPMIAKGIFEKIHGRGGVLVYASDNYSINPLSVYISQEMINAFGIKKGHELEVIIHKPREGESCPFAIKINSISGKSPEENKERITFDELVPYYPKTRILLESTEKVSWNNVSMRIIDILAPIGFGQRGLIVAPPKTGKTVLLQAMAHAISLNKPEVKLIVLLVDERPEEVTDFKREVTQAEVVSSTFDQSPESHIHVAEMAIDRARRIVESGQDVVILLDSITRLARAYNALMPNSGRILSGGVEATALQKAKRIFGAARNIEEGGSLTIIATALVETGSRMDDVIFEEFKGTGNMELHLDSSLVEKRLFPAINLEKSGTRKEELLYHPNEIDKIYALRRAMKGVPTSEAMEMLIKRIKETNTNSEFLMGLSR